MPKSREEGTAVNTNRGGLPDGVHRMVVVSSDENMGGSGHPYWTFVCSVDEGDEWDEEIE